MSGSKVCFYEVAYFKSVFSLMVVHTLERAIYTVFPRLEQLNPYGISPKPPPRRAAACRASPSGCGCYQRRNGVRTLANSVHAFAEAKFHTVSLR
jgi:hypothetical protein